jgi:hypothetical protein
MGLVTRRGGDVQPQGGRPGRLLRFMMGVLKETRERESSIEMEINPTPR